MLPDNKIAEVTNVMLCSPSKSLRVLSTQAHLSQKAIKKFKFCEMELTWQTHSFQMFVATSFSRFNATGVFFLDFILRRRGT